MPSYTFIDIKSNEVTTRSMSWSEYDELEKNGNDYMIDGRLMRRDLRADMAGVPSTSGWPLESLAAGVAPRQVAEQRAELRRHGVDADHSKSGNPIFRDRAHRKKVLTALGMHDKDAGYGD